MKFNTMRHTGRTCYKLRVLVLVFRSSYLSVSQEEEHSHVLNTGLDIQGSKINFQVRYAITFPQSDLEHIQTANISS